MTKLDKLMAELTDYEVEVIKKALEIPDNKKEAEGMTSDEIAEEVVLTLSWHYKDSPPEVKNPAQAREELWKKWEKIKKEFA